MVAGFPFLKTEDWQVGVIVGEGEPADFPSDKPANITGKVYAVDALSGKTMCLALAEELPFWANLCCPQPHTPFSCYS